MFSFDGACLFGCRRCSATVFLMRQLFLFTKPDKANPLNAGSFVNVGERRFPFLALKISGFSGRDFDPQFLGESADLSRKKASVLMHKHAKKVCGKTIDG